jgi:hypothetical protein
MFPKDLGHARPSRSYIYHSFQKEKRNVRLLTKIIKKKCIFTKHTFQINVKYTDDNLVLQKLVRTCISIFGFFCSAQP